MLFHALLCPLQYLALSCASEVLCPELLAGSCPWCSAHAPLVGWSQPAAKHPHGPPVSVPGQNWKGKARKLMGQDRDSLTGEGKRKKTASEAKAVTHHVLQEA